MILERESKMLLQEGAQMRPGKELAALQVAEVMNL